MRLWLIGLRGEDEVLSDYWILVEDKYVAWILAGYGGNEQV